VSLVIGLAAVALAMAAGVPLGAVAGYFGGWTDVAISRVLDVLLGIPSILLAILMAAAMQRGEGTLILAVGIVGIPQFARQVRGSVLSLREQDFVQASRALGASPLRTLWREVLPNALGPIIVLATLGVGSAILTAAGLSFLGLGVETGTPEWGAMLYEGRRAFRSSPHLAVFAGLAITLTVLAINIFGDGLRDALDPKAEKKA
jgi:peptide/nickel transport system permease protein